mmetsp:Transcript_10662/g.23572  ORF Transcript_10662/g.23572 Transcript_10662/m.23572 type:complete len:212 (-) Transcript_10662:506-1141(-)
MLFRRIKSPLPPSTPLIGPYSEERGHLLPRFICRCYRNRDSVIFIHGHALILRQVLLRIPINSMRGKVGNIQKERLFFIAGHEKTKGISRIFLCDMPQPVPNLSPMPPIFVDHEIKVEISVHIHPKPNFTSVRRGILFLLFQKRVNRFILWNFKLHLLLSAIYRDSPSSPQHFEVMPCKILTAVQCCTRAPAYAGCYTIFSKPHPLLRYGI